MAVPKRKTSKSRKRKRRTHYVLTQPGLRPCANCGAYGRSHRVCPDCGYYKGRQVIIPVQKKIRETDNQSRAR